MLSFSSPFGRSVAEMDPAETSVYLEELAGYIAFDRRSFAGDTVETSFDIDPAIPAESASLLAIWPGALQLGAQNMVTIQMNPTMHEQLMDLLGPDIPAPKQATYGPIDRLQLDPAIEWRPGQCAIVGHAGTRLGAFTGNTFLLKFQGAEDYYLDPLTYIQVFMDFGLWKLNGHPYHPLLPAGLATNYPILIAGPHPVPRGERFLSIRGGSFSKPHVIFNPPASLTGERLPVEYFSFTSKDQITVQAHNIRDAYGPLLVEDVTEDRSLRSAPQSRYIVTNSASASFVPENDFRPSHPPARDGGRRDGPNAPLTYWLQFHYSTDATNPTEPWGKIEISQDMRDIIRQEYLFYSTPIQGRGPQLTPPKRTELVIRRTGSDHFKAAKVGQLNNYWSSTGLLLNPDELFQVAETLRADYLTLLQAALSDDFPIYATAGLHINSAWRNPERNAAVNGVPNSNHQFGRALDLAPAFGGKSDTKTAAMGALFEAALYFW